MLPFPPNASSFDNAVTYPESAINRVCINPVQEATDCESSSVDFGSELIDLDTHVTGLGHHPQTLIPPNIDAHAGLGCPSTLEASLPGSEQGLMLTHYRHVRSPR
jgi:hypothetical protein